MPPFLFLAPIVNQWLYPTNFTSCYQSMHIAPASPPLSAHQPGTPLVQIMRAWLSHLHAELSTINFTQWTPRLILRYKSAHLSLWLKVLQWLFSGCWMQEVCFLLSFLMRLSRTWDPTSFPSIITNSYPSGLQSHLLIPSLQVRCSLQDVLCTQGFFSPTSPLHPDTLCSSCQFWL